MKMKKIISVFLLVVLFMSQFSFIRIDNHVYAAENQNVDAKFHYNQLTDEAKKIYNALHTMYVNGILKTGSQDYDLVANGYFTEEEAKNYEKGSSELITAMNAARYAFYADYPEIFYVEFQKMSIRTTKDAENKYHVYLGSGRYKDYFVDGFTTENIDKAIEDFNNKVDEIVEKANNITEEAEEDITISKIKLIHNEIINNTGYRLESDCTPGNESFIGTPYGALVKGQAVCEGYARSIKVLLDRIGVENILVQGLHQSEGSAAVPHMWNYVQIEKQTTARATEKVWYAIDTTMDDPFLRDTNMDSSDVDFKPGDDIVEGFENTRFCMVGKETMNKEHTPLEVVEAAGNYKFKYPEINDEDYGIDAVTNSNGLLVKFKQEGTSTEEYTAGDFYISYNEKGYAAAKAEGKYILMKYHEYRPGDELWVQGNWGYMDPEYYAGGFIDYGDHLYISVPNGEYVEFAVTTLAPSSGIAALTYQGDESDFVARSGKIYNPNGIYKAPPYVKTQVPPSTQTLSIGPTYHVDVTFDDDLVFEEGVTEVGYRMESSGATGAEKSEITNLKFDGKRRITFDLKFSEMYADDEANYNIYVTGLVGKNSGKAPNSIVFGAAHDILCAQRMNMAKNWEVFARPTLLESEDLSLNGWETKDGKPVSEKLRSRIALVTTRTTKAEQESMNNLIENELQDTGLIKSETYNISLNVCRDYVVKTGHRLRLALGFPAGYGPEDAGVTFKAYHFITDDNGNVTGVEEIPCVVTQYGLIVTCDSFSPFAIAVTEKDETEVVTTKAAIVTTTDGGQINGASRESGNIITLDENQSATMSIVPNEGYQIESITVCGENKEITNKDGMDLTVNYADIKDGNNIVDVKFVAKEVVQKEEERQEVPVQPVVEPAEVTMPENVAVAENELLEIAPTVTETTGIQTYQWYKDGVKLEGKTNKILQINGATLQDAGEYVLKVTTTVDTTSVEVESAPCTVEVRETVGFGTSLSLAGDSANAEQLYAGDEFEVDFDINGLSSIENGLIALGGQLEYDSNILEKLEVNANRSQWNQSDINEKNFRFITDAEEAVTTDGNVLTIKFKVKDTVTDPVTTTVKVKNIEASNGKIDITANAASLELNVKKRITEITSDLYTVEEGYITRIPEDTTVAELKSHIEPKDGIIVTNKAGEELSDDTILATGMILKADELEFVLVVIGDVNESGGVTVTDLAQLKLHYIEEEILTGANLKAADIDGNGVITITDIAKLKLMLIGEE